MPETRKNAKNQKPETRTIEVVDTAFGPRHSCGRAEEVYPPKARTNATWGRRWTRGGFANSAGC